MKDFTYLDNNLLSTEVWKSSGTPVNTLTYTFNGNDQMLTAGDANGTITFTYDDLGRVKTQKDVWGITLTNTWDAADRLTKVEDSKGGTREYTFNNANLATTMTYSDGSSQLRLDYTYSARDQVTNIKRYTDTAGATLESETVYGLDDEGKALTITHKNAGGTTVDSFTYQYDLADRITRETSTLGPTNTYTYDRTSQVTGDGTESFAWDANGNPSGGGNSVTTGNRLTSDGTWTYTHDDAGNVIEKAKSGEYWFYGYDHNNRLTHLEKRTTEGGSSVLSVDFKYNIFGDRIERDYDADGAGAGAAVVLKMAYEDGNAWADMDSGLTVSTRRVYEGGLDSLVARINSGSQEDWYLTDVIGSVRDIVNGSGTLIDHIDYSVFGTPTETQPNSGDRYKFTSREWETEALIQYNRARYLQYGRWMTQDPLGFDAGDSNLYRYVSNNPITGIDPRGKDIVIVFDKEAKVPVFGKVGHPAVLIGNDKDGWRYFSFHAGDQGTTDDNVESIPFKTLDNAKKDARLKDYDEFIRYETTKQQDENAIKEALKWKNKTYDLVTQNCALYAYWIAKRAALKLPVYRVAFGYYPTSWWNFVARDAKTNPAVIDKGNWGAVVKAPASAPSRSGGIVPPEPGEFTPTKPYLPGFTPGRSNEGYSWKLSPDGKGYEWRPPDQPAPPDDFSP